MVVRARARKHVVNILVHGGEMRAAKKKKKKAHLHDFQFALKHALLIGKRCAILHGGERGAKNGGAR